MKHKDTVSAVVGSMFFAGTYLALSLPIVPSLFIGVSAFCAGELVFSKSGNNIVNENFKEVIDKAKKQNKHILEMKSNIDNDLIIMHLTNIHNYALKIIKTIEKEPGKIKSNYNFFDYYLPVTVKIIDRYDEIENQKLSSKDSKKIVNSTIKMLEAVSGAFEHILNSLYQKEIIDMDAEMKVFSSMLKADGLDDSELKIKEDE